MLLNQIIPRLQTRNRSSAGPAGRCSERTRSLSLSRSTLSLQSSALIIVGNLVLLQCQWLLQALLQTPWTVWKWILLRLLHHKGREIELISLYIYEDPRDHRARQRVRLLLLRLCHRPPAPPLPIFSRRRRIYSHLRYPEMISHSNRQTAIHSSQTCSSRHS